MTGDELMNPGLTVRSAQKPEAVNVIYRQIK